MNLQEIITFVNRIECYRKKKIRFVRVKEVGKRGSVLKFRKVTKEFELTCTTTNRFRQTRILVFDFFIISILD